MKIRYIFTLFCLVLFNLTPVTGQVRPERQWPGYRGYLASGVLDNADLPDTFDFVKSINILWRIKIPGMGISSPAIWDDKLFITTAVSESDKAGFKPGLYGDVNTGKELWKNERDEYPGWCTPNIYTFAGRRYIAVNGYKNRGGYDIVSGKEIWKMSGGGDIQIPTPIIGNDLIYFNSAHGKNSPILAVKKSATGDITLKENETANRGIQWSIPRGGSYMHTLLLYRDHLYNVNWNGSVICLDPATGKEIYNAKLGKANSFIASPVAADGRVYIVDEEGTVYIIQDGNTFKLLAEIPMNDICMTAPAITDKMIYFRTQNWLYAVGKK